jgi:MraZ protein
MFSGTYSHTVDDKGRVAIPARFREELSQLQDELIFVTRWKRRDRPCLDAYPASRFARLQRKLDKLPGSGFGGNREAFTSWYVGAAQDVRLDAQNRLLIPPQLREYATIGREVVLAGAGDRFRIWNKELFHQVDNEDGQALFESADFMNELGL